VTKVSFSTKRLKVTLALVIAIVAVLITGYFYSKSLISKDDVITVTKSNFASTIMTTGKVTSDNLINVKSEITAKVISSDFNVGDSFSKDDTLIRYEDSDMDRLFKHSQIELAVASNNLKTITDKELIDAEETVTQARIELKKAEEAYQKNSILYEAGAISKSELDNLKYGMDIAVSKLSTAENNKKALLPQGVKYNDALLKVREAETNLTDSRANIEKTIMKAPFEGVILKKYFEVGEIAETGKELLIIARKNDELYIKSSIDEKYIPSLKTGQRVFVRPEAFDGLVIDGYITKIAPSVDSQKGTIDIEVKMNSFPEFLKPELSVSLEIVTEEYVDVIVLDKKYVDFSAGTKVWVKGKSSKDIRDIEIIHDLGDKVIVGKGLVEGEMITSSDIKN